MRLPMLIPLFGMILILAACANLPNILTGRGLQDGIKSVEDTVEIFTDPANKKQHESDAINDALDAAVEIGEELVGLPDVKVNLQVAKNKPPSNVKPADVKPESPAK